LKTPDENTRRNKMAHAALNRRAMRGRPQVLRSAYFLSYNGLYRTIGALHGNNLYTLVIITNHIVARNFVNQ